MSKPFALDSLFQAIQRSVMQATKVAQASSIRSMQRDYFEVVVDEEGKETGELRPKTVKLLLPHHEDDTIVNRAFDVPLYSLVNHQTMAVSELDMEFEIELHGFGGDDESPLEASTDGGSGERRKVAKIRMKFNGVESPEGVMRINDKILKTFP